MLNSRLIWNSGENAKRQKPEFLNSHYQLAISYPALKKKGISESLRSFVDKQQRHPMGIDARLAPLK